MRVPQCKAVMHYGQRLAMPRRVAGRNAILYLCWSKFLFFVKKFCSKFPFFMVRSSILYWLKLSSLVVDIGEPVVS
jgi:hypothetical protein